MKFLTFAAVASAFAIPDASVISQLVLADNKAAAGKAVKAVHAVETAKDTVKDWIREGLSPSVPSAFDTDKELNAVDLDALSTDLPIFDPIVVGGKSKTSNLTLYQLIASSANTTQFVSLINEFPELVTLLNTTTLDDPAAVNHTLFVPVDTAFAALPGWNETTTAVRESIVRYHIGVGDLPYKVLFATHTVPSLYDEPLLGGEAQRLRVRFEKKLGVRVNFAARIVAPNFIAANGVLHAIDSVVVPPTFVGRQLSLVPDHYSSLLLAMQSSNFTQYIHGLTLNGSTVLAPSNAAFTLLGPELNAFLFNTPRGLKYLQALLKYSTVPNATVYSDAFYGPTTLVPPAAANPGFVQRLHYQLPTLLGPTVSVNVTSVPGYTVMLVNSKVRVAVQDGVAKNGVIQEVDHVVFPPLPATVPGSPWVDPPVKTVADLVARLGPYVEDDGDDEVAAAPAAAPVNEL
ncbi:hypothetical protein SEUCBS139899_004231 [Sporothrix eucalyptigena]|uniref:FAS1 domain-containing protein n=1 Tax=Sporothrix eucalyptigena TaxID=1812306 RepID=A0ABP0B085_9PEZI